MVEVKESNLGGEGLFAKQHLQEGIIICLFQVINIIKLSNRFRDNCGSVETNILALTLDTYSVLSNLV